MKINPIQAADFYKYGHKAQYPDGTTKIYSNLTPRSNKLANGIDKAVFAGLQGFIKWFLIDTFNKHFFWIEKDIIIEEYNDRTNKSLGPGSVDSSHIAALHDLGYLPIEIKALPEGSLVPMKVPFLTITNTLPEFFWLVNYLETVLSAELWKPITNASIALEYKKVLTKYAQETGAPVEFVQWQGHDFSMRGMSGIHDAANAGIGHLFSFLGTDTEVAIQYIENYYQGKDTFVGGSVPACYDDKTEILTEDGFVYFKDLDKNKLVAMYSSDGTISFVKPSEFYDCAYNGKMIHFTKNGYNYVDTLVTPNHKMVRKNEKGVIELFEANSKEYKFRAGYSHRNKIIVAGHGVGSLLKLSTLEKLKIAFQADGSFPSHKEDYTGEISNSFPIRFSLKKERKVNRLTEICTELNIKFTKTKYKNGYYSFWINSPVEMQKDLNWVDISNISDSWAKEFIEELSQWDGSNSSKNTITYSSVVKSCVEKSQVIGILAGYKTQYNEYKDKRDNRQSIYSITFTKNKAEVSGEDVVKSEINYTGKVYCVSVPTKMLVVRRNNTIIICGNTEHSTMSCNILDIEQRLLNNEKFYGLSAEDIWDKLNLL